jgi:uncharacterized repeat protein (TIGR01451 family)
VLTLSKSADPGTEVASNGLITYTLTVGAQNAAINGVVLTDTLPVDTTFVAASDSYTRSGPGNSIISWSLNSLNAGQTATRTLTVQVLPDAADGTTISNASYRASATDAPTVNGAPVNVTVRGAVTGVLTLNKTADPGTEVVIGRPITYTLTVGAQNAVLNDVSLTDALPVGTEFVAASGSYTRSGPENNIISWNVGTLAAGGSAARTLTVRVLPGVADGTTISNASYQASATGAATVNGRPVNVTARRPQGTLTLTAWVDPDNELVANQPITYVITIGAQGVDVEGVVLTDTVPSGTHFVSASGSYTRSGTNNNTITWNIGTVPAGQTVRRTLTVFIPGTTPDETMISNDTIQVIATNAATVKSPPIYVRVRAALLPYYWVPMAS